MMKKIPLLLLSTIIFVSGCGDFRGAQSPDPAQPAPGQANNNPFETLEQREGRAGEREGREGREDQEKTVHSRLLSVTIDHEISEEMTVYIRDDKAYIPLVSILDFLGYETRERNEGRTIQAGFTDVLYEVQKDSNQATVLEKDVTLSTPVVTYKDQTYITSESLEELLGHEYEITLKNDSLTINTIKIESIFPGNEDLGDVEINEDADVPAVSRSEAYRIIRTARRYVGAPYSFGARTGNTSRFDCSSLTQYAYGVNGISLPRTSRAQAREGRYIPVSQLRAGDLLFFYWPGRYRSNRIVGHVAIYMGNGYMIQATPNRGVHITNGAESRYWRSVYLGAKRVG
jgi:cell wall-associated NlpC family hydrolase